MLAGSRQRNAADRHLMLLQEFIELRPFCKMTEGKAAVDFGLVFALGGELGQEVVELVDGPRVVLTELQRLGEEPVLNLL